MVYTLIDRDIRHHTGQNVVDLRGAVNQIATLLPLRKTVKLLNNPREKVEEIINHCSVEPEATSFSLIAQVLPNSVVNSIDKESIAHILLITHITINRQLNKFTWFNQQKLRVLLWKVFLQTQKHLNFLLARFALPRKQRIEI